MSRVLIFQDRSEDMDLESTIQSMGHKVVYVTPRQKEAINKAKKLDPELILIDVNIKDDKSLSSTLEFKKLDLPLIFLINESEEAALKPILSSEPYSYLLKPTNIKELKLTIEMTLRFHQMGESLRASENKYQSLFDNMLNGFAYCQMIFDGDNPIDFIYIDVNQAFESLTGLKDVIGRKVSEVIPGIRESDPELLEIYGRVALTGQPETFEMHLKSIKTWFSVAVYCPRKEYFVAVFDVITERKETEKALQESEHKFRELVENAADALFVLDFNGRFVDVNRQSCESLGYTREELLQMKVTDIEQDFDLESTQREWIKIKPGEPFTLYGHQKRKDGTIFPVEIRFAVVNIDEERLIMGLVRDITDIRKAEKELRNSKQRFEQVAQSAGEWIWEVDARGLYTYSSPVLKDLLGYQVEDIVAKKHFYDLFSVDERDKLKDMAMDVFARKEPFTGFINTCIHKDGRKVILETKGLPILNEKGELLGYRGADADITERYLANKKIEESEEKIRFITDNMTDVVVQMDSKGVITYFSPSVKQATGFNPQDLLGKNVVELVHPDDREMLSNVFQESITSEAVNVEYRTLKSDGSYFWMEAIGKAVYNSAGDFESVVFTARDISDRKKAEKALLESEEKYRLISENTGDVIWTIDLNLEEFTYVSPSIYKLTGYTSEEFLEQPIEKSITPEYYQFLMKIVPERLQDFLSGDESARVQTNRVDQLRKDGSVVPIEAVTTLLTDEEGNITMLGVTRDITERRKAEKALEESQERYKSIFDESLDAIYLADLEGNIINANPSACKMVGYSLEEVKKMNLMSLLNSDQIFFALETIDLMIDQGYTDVIELKFKRKDGSQLYLETRASLISSPGKPDYIQGVARDITERKASQQKLEKSEEKYRTIIETTQEGVWILDAEANTNYVNQAMADMLGYSVDEMMGKPLFYFVDDEAKIIATEKLERRRAGIKEIYDFCFIHKDGTEVWTIISTNPFFDEKGDYIGVLGMLSDITERKKAEEKIKNSLEEKESLLREIHHRVKNNMQIISSLLYLQSDNVQEKETKDILTDSQSRIRSMAMIHENLYMSPDISHINFKEYIEKLVSDILYTYGSGIGLINTNLNVENIELNMETAIPLGLIINELLTNSLKYAFPDGEGLINVKLKQTRIGEHALIIADDGIGLPEDIDYTKTTSLGLQLVNNLVNQIDGEISLDRSQGTKFTIKFKELSYKERMNL